MRIYKSDILDTLESHVEWLIEICELENLKGVSWTHEYVRNDVTMPELASVTGPVLDPYYRILFDVPDVETEELDYWQNI